MPTAPFFLTFKRIVEGTLRQMKHLSLRHFIDEYDYDDFLEGEGVECGSPRELALAFGVRFLGLVPVDYGQALSIALVTFLAESAGRKNLDPSDLRAVKDLFSLPIKDETVLGQWLDSYFEDVA